jgi:hypothetical protein
MPNLNESAFVPEYDDSLDTPGAAMVINCSPKTLEKKRHTGDGPPYFKIGKLVRYRRSRLLAYINARERTSTSDRGE